MIERALAQLPTALGDRFKIKINTDPASSPGYEQGIDRNEIRARAAWAEQHRQRLELERIRAERERAEREQDRDRDFGPSR